MSKRKTTGGYKPRLKNVQKLQAFLKKEDVKK